MKKLFYTDTHILDFQAIILESISDEKNRGYWLVLDQTAFFPEEGGQSADKGTIDGLEVLDVQLKDDIIYHLVKLPIRSDDGSDTVSHEDKTAAAHDSSVIPPEITFAPGQTVTGHVDWEQRFDFMQQHSGEHIISGLLHSHFGFHNVGFHLGTTEVTLDFDQSISMEMLRDIEREANRIVWQNLAVHTTFPSKKELAKLEYRSKMEIDGDVRIVEIPGVDVCACCAPHVAHTGEIGIIKITNVQSHRGGVRINILCGKRALADYTFKQETASAISVLLSAKQDRLTDSVKKIQNDALLLKHKSNLLAEQLLQLQIASLPLPANQPNPVLFVELDNPMAVRRAVNSLCEKYPGYCSIFFGNEEAGYQFIIGSATKDCRVLATKLQTSLGAKCGGTSPMIQGSVNISRLRLEVFFSTQ